MSNIGRRRITRLLDHPAVKGWALFSWLLVIVGLMVRQRALAMVSGMFFLFFMHGVSGRSNGAWKILLGLNRPVARIY